MRAIILAIGVVASSVPSGPTMAQTTAKPVASMTTCQKLAADWKLVELNLARNLAAGMDDDSAPRATLRAVEDSASMTSASITMRLMEVNHCPLPTRAPSGRTYMLKAMDCKLAELKANSEQIRAHPV